MPLPSFLKGLDGPDVIPGEQTEDSESGKIRLSLLTPLLGRDASQDGVYTIEVRAVDKAGNEADLVQVSFRYDNRAPTVSVSPMESDASFNPAPDTNYYNLPITGFVVTFEDTGIGLDLDR